MGFLVLILVLCGLHKNDLPSIHLSSKAIKSMCISIIYHYKFNSW